MTQRSGVLYVVATPIGNMEDLSPRARRILAEVDLVLAEDTRHTGQFLAQLGIHAALRSLHDYNEAHRVPAVLEALLAGQSVALVSDAGTPLISDPGFPLVRAARKAGITVTPVPGACALIAALSVGGLPTDRFRFEGFLPNKHAARLARLEALKAEPCTLVFYESPRRLAESLQDMTQALGGDRQAVVARELTKLHESVRSGTLNALQDWVRADLSATRGEAVVLVEGVPFPTDGSEEERVLRVLLEELPIKQAVTLTAKLTGGNRNKLYKLALRETSQHEDPMPE